MTINWQQSALLFPGQGSQQVGMTKSLAAAYAVVQNTFQEADDLLGYSLSELCFEGPAEKLNETLYTQPALYVAGVATFRALRDYLKDHTQEALSPAYTAGHSLGEFTALVAAEALSFEDGLKLVQKRAELMHEAGEKSPGAVAALLGLDIQAVKQVCTDAQEKTGETVVVANDNCSGQVVISGANAAIDKALELASQAGAKRAVKLAVSVAVHSPLMKPAGEEFARTVEITPIRAPKIPIIANVTAEPILTVSGIKDELKAQITSSVLWHDSIQTMLKKDVQNFVELGPGGVLVGLVKRIDRKAKRITLETPQDFESLLAD